MSETKRIYWDSDCLIAWLNKEEERKSICEGTLLAAEQCKVLICISALSYTEVIKLKEHENVPKTAEQKIVDFFDNPFFEVYDVDQWVGTRARFLIWEYGLDPKDSIHVATALLNDIPELNTFDKQLLKLNNKLKLESLPGNLRICQPSISTQAELFSSQKLE